MQTFFTALSSRTVWTVAAMFVISGTNGIMGLIPSGDIVYVQGFLSLLAVYFRLNPSQSYKG